MRVSILSLFSDYFEGPLRSSILHRAMRKGILDVNLVDLRSFSVRKGGRVDDQVVGGGPGMVIEAPVVLAAYRSVATPKTRSILLTPAGRPLDTSLLKELAQEEELVFFCGHYEGIDERGVSFVDDRISVGDYVLTNGCLAALVILDALSRFLHGVVGNADSVKQDSFENGMLDCPHYTRPRNWLGVAVPEVLLSGNHACVAEYRKAVGNEATSCFRPDLFMSSALCSEKGTICFLRFVTTLSYLAEWYEEALSFSIKKDDTAGLSVAFGAVSVRFVHVTVNFFEKLAPMQTSLCLSAEEWGRCASSLQRLDWPFVVSTRENNSCSIQYLRVADPSGLEWVLVSRAMVV